MSIHRGGKGKYLGMHLDFMEEGVFQVHMSKYVEGIINEFPEPIQKSSPTPHSDSFFTVKDKNSSKPLCKDKARQFHRMTAKLRFLCTRAKKDIQTMVSFLTTVTVPPWNKVAEVENPSE
ncbi:hypothetical protein ACHAW6_005478 [Cyclotella cf. meneghiniana]